jgi:predicted amidohydrolase
LTLKVRRLNKEEDYELIGGTWIIAPTGEIVTECKTLDDQVILAECYLDRCKEIQENIFNFDLHRQPKDYALITAAKKEPPSNH